MSEEQREIRKSLDVPGAGNGGETAAGPSQSSANREERSATPLARAAEAERLGTTPLQRAGTLPPRSRRDDAEHNVPDINRRRGRTISSRPRNFDAPRPLSPRSQLFKRSSAGRENNGQEGSVEAIPEGGREQTSTRRPRRSTASSRLSFSSPGMRPRVSTWAVSPGMQRGGTIRRRPSLLIAAPAQATGRDIDAQSATFTLAGPTQMDTLAANQPYVDPGYADLNPAYDQPVNSRPVWGLAKPLPRVIRPGMVPARSELKLQIPDAEEQKQDVENIDLEQGRVEATLRVNKISPQLQQARQQRENRLLQTYSRTGGPSTLSPISPLNQRSSSVILPTSLAIESEGKQDVGTAKQTELAPVPEQPTRPGTPEQEQEQQEQEPENWLPEDASSILTAKDADGALDGDWIGEEITLKAYDPETDEIHNLHTHWSVIRLRFREPLAELLAVTVQLTLGFCADLVVVTSANKAGNEATTDWAWGLATMVGIYIAGGMSGAHLNPAISIMLYIYRGFPLRKIPIYILAQILGAFLAGLIAFANSGTLNAFITYPRYEYIGAATAFLNEFTATAILSVAVLALGDDTNAPPGAGMNAFILGLVITVLSMAFGYNTGAAMNPARDLGLRLALLVVGYGGSVFRNAYWVYGPWLATISGAAFGAFLYDVCIFVGGESPVNYPRKRILRAGRLRRGKQRLLGRSRRGEGDVGNGVAGVKF